MCGDTKQKDHVLLLHIVDEGQQKSTRSAYSGAESYAVHHVRSGLFLTLTILSFKKMQTKAYHGKLASFNPIKILQFD